MPPSVRLALVPAGTILPLSLAFGLLIGFSLGLLGGGGSVLTVPILVYAVGLPVASAIPTSLAIVGATAAMGALGYHRKRRVRWRTALLFGLVGSTGALVGAWLSHLAAPRAILVLFSFVMIGTALSMFRRAATEEHWGEGAAERPHRPHVTLTALTGLGVGLLTGFFGVGGGFAIVPALVVVLGLPMRDAVGTSLAVIALNSGAALLGHLRFGAVDLPITALFLVGGLFGTSLGRKLSGRLPERTLQRLFAVLLVVLAGFVLYENR
jgi:uncharacterized membrane protein YfcA